MEYINVYSETGTIVAIYEITLHKRVCHPCMSMQRHNRTPISLDVKDCPTCGGKLVIEGGTKRKEIEKAKEVMLTPEKEIVLV